MAAWEFADALPVIEQRVGKHRNNVSLNDLSQAIRLLERIEILAQDPDLVRRTADLQRYVKLREKSSRSREYARSRPQRQVAAVRAKPRAKPEDSSTSLRALRAQALRELRDLAPLPSSVDVRARIDELQKRSYSDAYSDAFGNLDLRRWRAGEDEKARLRASLPSTERKEGQFEHTNNRLMEAIRQAGAAKWQSVLTKSHRKGSYTVTLVPSGSSREQLGREERLRDMLVLHCGITRTVADETIKRAKHVAPELLVEGVSLDDAIEIKADIELCGATVKIKEGVRPRGGRREPIPESVRREVWRRDEGRCVDCGSRERLEYDHIVPVSKGGSNTVRNIELRCEPCNRRKAAGI